MTKSTVSYGFGRIYWRYLWWKTSFFVLIDKDMVRESVSKMKTGKATLPSGLVLEMVKAAGEAEVEVTIDIYTLFL